MSKKSINKPIIKIDNNYWKSILSNKNLLTLSEENFNFKVPLDIKPTRIISIGLWRIIPRYYKSYLIIMFNKIKENNNLKIPFEYNIGLLVELFNNSNYLTSIKININSFDNEIINNFVLVWSYFNQLQGNYCVPSILWDGIQIPEIYPQMKDIFHWFEKGWKILNQIIEKYHIYKKMIEIYNNLEIITKAIILELSKINILKNQKDNKKLQMISIFNKGEIDWNGSISMNIHKGNIQIPILEEDHFIKSTLYWNALEIWKFLNYSFNNFSFNIYSLDIIAHNFSFLYKIIKEKEKHLLLNSKLKKLNKTIDWKLIKDIKDENIETSLNINDLNNFGFNICNSKKGKSNLISIHEINIGRSYEKNNWYSEQSQYFEFVKTGCHRLKIYDNLNENIELSMIDETCFSLRQNNENCDNFLNYFNPPLIENISKNKITCFIIPVNKTIERHWNWNSENDPYIYLKSIHDYVRINILNE
jgi:hypothetical protein